MSAKKDRSPELTPHVVRDESASDDTVLTAAALREQALQLDPEGVTIWTPENGFTFAGRTLQCDYEDLDYRGLFSLLGGFSGRGPQIADA